jgi:hypothetical protein
MDQTSLAIHWGAVSGKAPKTGQISKVYILKNKKYIIIQKMQIYTLTTTVIDSKDMYVQWIAFTCYFAKMILQKTPYASRFGRVSICRQ